MCVLGELFVQAVQTFQGVGNPSPGQHRTRFVKGAYVVVGIGPVHTDKDRQITSVLV